MKIKYFLHKGRPLTLETLRDLNALTAILNAPERAIPAGLTKRLHEAGIEVAVHKILKGKTAA